LAVHSKRAAWHVLPQHTAALNGLTRFTCVTPAPQKALVRHFCLTLELKKHIGDPVLPVRGPDPTRGNVHYIDGTEFKFGPHIHDQYSMPSIYSYIPDLRCFVAGRAAPSLVQFRYIFVFNNLTPKSEKRNAIQTRAVHKLCAIFKAPCHDCQH